MATASDSTDSSSPDVDGTAWNLFIIMNLIGSQAFLWPCQEWGLCAGLNPVCEGGGEAVRIVSCSACCSHIVAQISRQTASQLVPEWKLG